ncbi:MAG TPA: amidase [Burkholderiaceae bacterium]|nr:amidase [Burkholderiaceae bacterium]
MNQPDEVQPWQISASDLQRRYRDGSLTPRAVAESCLARLDVVNPQLNAVVARRDTAVLEEANAAGARFAAGRPLSALDGIPLSIKDNLLMRDLPTTWGSPALREHQPAVEELAVARARAGGALLIGKTNVPEFALEGYTRNRLFGTTRNPWNTALTPGGSSGGAVASVAAGVTPLALGTDGGGSIRRPASHCGLVGLKPSIGALPREHTLPSLLLDFEVVGPIARTVADVALLFNAVRGAATTDRRSLAAQAAQAARRHEAALRVLYVPTLGGAPVDAEIAASCAAAARRLEQLGHGVTEGALPLALDFMTEAWPLVGQVGLASMFARLPAWREGASPQFLEMAERGARVAAAQLWEVIESVEQLRRDCARLFAEIDVIVTPAAAALPWPADEVYPPVIAGQPVGPRGHAVFTAWVNAAGLPALALPAQPSASGLPIGIQMIAGYGGDDLLLALGADYEAAAPWADRRPSL